MKETLPMNDANQKKIKTKNKNEDEWENICSEGDSKENENEGSILQINKSPGKVEEERIPKINIKNLERMNTLRIQKIQQILKSKHDIQGIKIFDLHLLNMKK